MSVAALPLRGFMFCMLFATEGEHVIYAIISAFHVMQGLVSLCQCARACVCASVCLAAVAELTSLVPAAQQMISQPFLMTKQRHIWKITMLQLLSSLALVHALTRFFFWKSSRVAAGVCMMAHAQTLPFSTYIRQPQLCDAKWLMNFALVGLEQML